jgi:PBP1b-binding outer membrane lipoprotein LpoB
MKKLSITLLIITLAVVFSGFSASAEDFPSQAATLSHSQTPPQNPTKPFEGYVPPPPIRHTWPGGYKVIFHEMMNTLMEHVIGHY